MEFVYLRESYVDANYVMYTKYVYIQMISSIFSSCQSVYHPTESPTP